MVEAGWTRCAEMGKLSAGQGKRLKLTKEGPGDGGHGNEEGRRGEGTVEGSGGEGGSRDADKGDEERAEPGQGGRGRVGKVTVGH